MKQKLSVPLLHIGPAADSNIGKSLIPVLEKIAMRATELGRDSVAEKAVEALQDMGSVRNVTVSGCQFSGGAS
jgi:hypothetical protein